MLLMLGLTEYTVQKTQFARFDDSPPLDKHVTKQVQAILGALLYHARTADPITLPALNETYNPNKPMPQKTQQIAEN